MKYLSHIILTATLLCGFSQAVLAQYTETREIEKQFKIADGARIEVSNKYGKIEVHAWEKDSVRFMIKLRVNERKLSKLEKTLKGIDFDFTNTPHFVVARTVVNQTGNALQREIARFRETVLNEDGNVEINYEVWLPNKGDLYLENKYGNIYLDDHGGEVHINQSNGNLKVHKLTGSARLELNFVNATINSVNKARLNSSYSDLYIKNAKELQIESKQCRYEVLEVEDIDIKARRDKYRIRVADVIRANGSFSNFRVAKLNDALNLRASYGDIDLEKINPEFSSIYIEGKSTDVNLYFDKDAKFDFEITHQKSELDLCREIKIETEKTVGEKEKKKLDGSFGTTSEKQEKLIINTVSGEINIFSN